MLTASELAAMQAVATSALDSTATIERNSPTADVWGGQTPSWATLATGVRCGLAKPSPAMLQQVGGRIGAVQSWLVSLPYGTDIREGDRLLVGGQTLLVQVDVSLSSYSTLTQVLASEVRQS